MLVLELMAGGLSSVIGDVDDPIQIPQVKAYSRMILEGCSHLHKLKIMHRVRKVFFVL